MQLCEKQKTFTQFFATFLKCKSNFEHFGTREEPLAYVFPNLGPAKDVVRDIFKK